MPDENDYFKGEHCYIHVNPSQNRFHLYSEDTDTIQILDIANALSNQPRFMGHLPLGTWYSVAEHCMIVSEIIKELGGDKDEQFAGLMHDTPEAYLADIAAPFKRELGNYHDVEAMVWKRISGKYGIPEALPDIVKKADWMALFIEATSTVYPDNLAAVRLWKGWKEHGEDALSSSVLVKCYEREEARRRFLEKFTYFYGV